MQWLPSHLSLLLVVVSLFSSAGASLVDRPLMAAICLGVAVVVSPFLVRDMVLGSPLIIDSAGSLHAGDVAWSVRPYHNIPATSATVDALVVGRYRVEFSPSPTGVVLPNHSRPLGARVFDTQSAGWVFDSLSEVLRTRALSQEFVVGIRQRRGGLTRRTQWRLHYDGLTGAFTPERRWRRVSARSRR